ncbi:hypothetical protein M427DRAFT_116563 [Gonapodya prolifera JEL478]|uniref:60S ribosomal protein L6 n=1 Tax=Gonapodya prolifera (strain JEL478) TaxID=1344416 RepID=A0A139A0Y3_GONPJ|nr:hypothetical protein M427DRAFT_116563 [Gonapodya prolifera JEL478]|eukprot:KXS10013.1 hypothetical protein M427DRAFT_116563 [Gonapodya prolifera JEL478]
MPAPRNSFLKPGVPALSRSAVYRARAIHKGKGKVAAVIKKSAEGQTVEKKVGGAKNGGVRKVPVVKSSRWYPAEDVAVPKKSRKTSRPTKLRGSITPGTVLILLAGRFRGKRVVFLKQLEKTGLLLVTGPFRINGVPLKRVNQAYVIATSTKIDVSGVKIPDHLDDDYFKRDKSEAEPEDGKKPTSTRLADQKSVDAAVLKAVKSQPLLRAYLGAKFSLKNNDVAHELKF